MNFGHMSGPKPTESGYGWRSNEKHGVSSVSRLVIGLTQPAASYGHRYHQTIGNAPPFTQIIGKVTRILFHPSACTKSERIPVKPRILNASTIHFASAV